ncbi:hypothetical protein JD969_08290 [Planctomycetota bacterium]|nr:hypothetical protein JD969_08290 [Planctomycetota bacterium]
MLKNILKLATEDFQWSAIVPSDSSWISGIPVEISANEEPLDPAIIQLIEQFITYLTHNQNELKTQLHQFYTECREDIIENCELWCGDLPEDESSQTIWETLDDFVICYSGFMREQPALSLIAGCDWQPDGGIEFIYENGSITSVNFQS